MTHAEETCRELWRQCVKYRDRWCVICGRVPMELKELEAHHIYFPRNLNWKIQFDTDFGVSLCFDCHHIKDFAPHINNELFLEKLLPRIDDPARAAKIIKFFNLSNKMDRFIETSDEIQATRYELCTERPDFKKIAAGLRMELKNYESIYWMNQDIEPYARGAVI